MTLDPLLLSRLQFFWVVALHILLPEHEPAIRRLFPEARIERIEDAGHWVHADRPAALLQILEPFLAGAV